jgi:hypothetical protein
MFAAVLLVALPPSPPSLAELDRLAQAQDVPELTKFLDVQPADRHNPFSIIRTKGAYEVGRFGWHALPLKTPGGTEYVVFSTPLTSEDTGELLFQRVGEKLKFVPESTGFGMKLTRHDFDLTFDIPTKKASIVDKLDLTNADGVAGYFLFRMSPQYIVSSIKDHIHNAVPFSEAGGIVATVKPAKDETYTITYSATVDLPNYAGSISPTEATLTNDYWYPMVARQPVPYDLTVHAPAKWLVIGQGDMIDDRDTPAEHTSRFKMDLPCVYYSVSAGPFKRFSQEINGKWYSCWSSSMTQSQMQAQTEFYAPIIEFYHRLSPFPFKGYGAVDSMVYGGGALEAYSFTTWGHGGLPTEDAHEPSHTWWGGMINNTYLGSFWNESFAVFSEGLYRRGVSIGNQTERKLAFIQDGGANDSYNAAPLAQSGADIGGVAGSLGYGKGSQVLQMLETLLGTDKMVATLQEWIKRCRGTDSDWGDYEAVVTSLYPEKDLHSFFDQWIRRPGYADLRVSGVQIETDHVSFDAGFNGPSFRIPLEVMLQYPDGARTFTMIDLKSPGPITIPCASKPSVVSIDPWRRVLRQIEGDESPTELRSLLGSLPRFTDPAHKEYLPDMSERENKFEAPADAAGKFIVGNPATMPILAGLCDKVGFKVVGDRLTYDGTTIDLNHGSALAVVDLGGGKQCIIGLGKTRVRPDPGRARLVLTDDLGRFLRGKTDPKTKGALTFSHSSAGAMER